MEEKEFLFSSCTLYNDELFFVDAINGLPAKMNPENGEITYYDIMEEFILQKGDRIDFISNFENKVYALESSGKSLMVFDLEKCQCRYNELKCNYQEWGNFAAFERYGVDYYIFPKYENTIFVINTDNHKIIEIPDYFENISKIQCCCRVENEIWILPEKGNIIGAYNLSEKEMEIYEMEETVENAVDAVFVNESIYILNQFGIIYGWNINNKKMRTITRLETEHTENETMCRIIYAGNKLIVFPSLGKDIKILDLRTYEMAVYHDYPADFFYQELKWSKYYGSCEDKNYYYFAMRSGNYLLKVCKQNGELVWIKPNIPSREERLKIQIPLIKVKMRTDFAAGRSVFYEGDGEIIPFSKIALTRGVSENEVSIGKKIYKKVKEIYE